MGTSNASKVKSTPEGFARGVGFPGENRGWVFNNLSPVVRAPSRGGLIRALCEPDPAPLALKVEPHLRACGGHQCPRPDRAPDAAPVMFTLTEMPRRCAPRSVHFGRRKPVGHEEAGLQLAQG